MTTPKESDTSGCGLDLLGESIMFYRLGVLVLVCVLALADKNAWVIGVLFSGVSMTMYKY